MYFPSKQLLNESMLNLKWKNKIKIKADIRK